MHRVFLDQSIPECGHTLAIDGDEAAHATRVKRLSPGDMLRLLDGAGVVADVRIESIDRPSRRDTSYLHVIITSRTEVPPIEPRLEVFTATPKGARVDDMIDQLSQVGAAGWAPLSTERGIVDPRPAKLDRLDRIAREAAKQSGRAWLLHVGPQRKLSELLADRAATTILADASGTPYHAQAGPLRLLIGPEGGWTPDELAAARDAGASLTRFGPHTMRIETAAIAAAAVIMALSSPPPTGEDRFMAQP